MKRTIAIEIDASDTKCNDCDHLEIRKAGFIVFDQIYPICNIFGESGISGTTNMKRPRVCLDAERKAKEG